MKNLTKLLGIIAVGAVICLSMAGCPTESEPNVPGTGLYVGIIGFNDNITRREIGLLTNNNKGQFQNFIDNLPMRAATGLYYAVDNAINMLETATLPDDLENVSIVTFTDGLDNASIDLKYKLQYTGCLP